MPLITIRDLNRIGRIGNQLFLVCFAKAYAKKLNCELQVPIDWIGRKIFTVTEPPVTHILPQTLLDSIDKQPLGHWFGAVDLDIRAYCQHQLYVDWYSRAEVCSWLTLKPAYEEYAPPLDEPPYSAMHLRVGDYANPVLRELYCQVSEESYQNAIKQFAIPSPVLRVFEGSAEPPSELREEGLDWLVDFLVLRDAAHLLRANSTFSVFAGWLGKGKVYAPLVGTKVGLNDVDFVEGAWPNTAGVFKNQSDLHLREI